MAQEQVLAAKDREHQLKETFYSIGIEFKTLNSHQETFRLKVEGLIFPVTEVIVNSFVARCDNFRVPK